MPHMPKVELVVAPPPTTTSVAVPDHLVAELVDGELWTSPRPAPRHAVAASSLGYTLGPPFHRGHGGPGGWLNSSLNPNCTWVLHTLVPDLAGWRRARLPQPARDRVLLAGARLGVRSALRVDRTPRPLEEAAHLRGARRRPCVAGRSRVTHARSASARRGRALDAARHAQRRTLSPASSRSRRSSWSWDCCWRTTRRSRPRISG